jgi:hypothetical protein
MNLPRLFASGLIGLCASHCAARASENLTYLSCKGSKTTVAGSVVVERKQASENYTIIDQKLIFYRPHSKPLQVEPLNYGEIEISYFVEKHPTFSFIIDMYLIFNRITGEVVETSKQQLRTKDGVSETSFQFVGICSIAKDRKF